MRKLLARILGFFKRENRKELTLADFKGVVKLKKFIGKGVYLDGKPLGVIEKIVADKKKEKAKKVYIRKNGKLLGINPQSILLENGRLKIRTSKLVRKETREAEREEIDYLSKAVRISNEIRKLKDKILRLDDKLIEGEIDIKTFKIVRKDLDSRIRELANKGKIYLEELRSHLREVYRKKILLEKEFEKYKIELTLGETKEEDVKGRLEALEEKIKELEKQVEKVRVTIETLEYYASEYTGDLRLIKEDLLSKIFEK